jgi:site-specific DNA recombinase
VRAAIYCRVSTDEQAERGTSLSTQEERCRAHVATQEWTLAEVFVDAGESGTKGSRPALDRMMAACRNGEIEVVVVTKLDRFGRSNRHLANALGDLDEMGVRFVSLSEQFDTSTPMGKGMLAIAGVFAEIEHATIRERMQLGRDAIRRGGYWTGGALPFGFRPVPDGAHKRLVVDEFQAETVKLAAELLVDRGYTTHEIAAHLNALGRPPGRAKRWTHGTIRHQLRRRHFVPEILSDERFAEIQAALDANKINRDRKRDHTYPLSLRIYGHCGAPYTGIWRRDIQRRFYMCKNKDWDNKATRCDDQAIDADDIEEVVWEQVCDLLSKPERLLDLAQQYLGLRSSQVEVERDSADETKAKLAVIERAIKNLLVTSAKEGLESDEIEAAVKDLTMERDSLRQHLAMIESWQADSERESERMRRLWALAERAHQRLPKMTPKEQKIVLDLLDVRVTIVEHVKKSRGGRILAPAKVRIEGVVYESIFSGDETTRQVAHNDARTASSRARAPASSPRRGRGRR